ncbi:hypothetical protein [Rufibacter ruber]|uniref:hypothetical protein n=1 Tax=Rufibacter ruber TaxID=1783499 RepID=UPI000833450E|nr:hypothetical protein [Rufibacter ruber]
MEDLLKELKDKYGVVYTVTVEDSEGTEQVAYFKKPDVATKKQLFKILAKDSDVFKGGEILIRSCFIGGFDVTTDEDAMFTASLAIVEMVDFKPATLKKN